MRESKTRVRNIPRRPFFSCSAERFGFQAPCALPSSSSTRINEKVRSAVSWAEASSGGLRMAPAGERCRYEKSVAWPGRPVGSGTCRRSGDWRSIGGLACGRCPWETRNSTGIAARFPSDSGCGPTFQELDDLLGGPELQAGVRRTLLLPHQHPQATRTDRLERGLVGDVIAQIGACHIPVATREHRVHGVPLVVLVREDLEPVVERKELELLVLEGLPRFGR